jgi:hypothetical protein
LANSVCVNPKEDLFIPIPICWVLKQNLQFVLFSNKKSYNAAVKSFYAAKGIDFGENMSDIVENAVLGVNSALPYTLAIRSPNLFSKKTRCVASCSERLHHQRDLLRQFQTLAILRWGRESLVGRLFASSRRSRFVK